MNVRTCILVALALFAFSFSAGLGVSSVAAEEGCGTCGSCLKYCCVQEMTINAKWLNCPNTPVNCQFMLDCNCGPCD